MTFDILCAGLATYDTLLSPIPEDIMQKDGAIAQEVRTGSGGDAVNTAISLAKLGIRVCVCGCVGDDSFADIIQSDLERAGACADGLVREPGLFTNAPVVLVSPTGERHIIRTAKGGNRFFNSGHIARRLLENTRHLHIASVNMLPGLDGEPLAELFRTAHELGIGTSMDASFDREGLWLKRIEPALRHCDIFIPSYQEATHYAGSEDLEEITRTFSKYGLKYFGVKLGADGVFVTDFERRHFLPSFFRGKPVDTTGAGDAFFAGFLAGYLRDMDLPLCAALGSAQAASVMRAVGANRSAGSWEDAVSCLRENGYDLPRRDTADETGKLQ
ncbi:carbohydrate kinase family protein [Feifania hominis]|uniref:Carbohydrate kinase family protein n=1 Tax=Feifania hominis TaxID=2763660 RepID=A0A926DFM6_9FIRM|nr:carbohydrate kinase family protein [Feifania hominis]MBC8536414.1 carbohydrate kinase family protein [Feifania hominis]